MHKLTIFIFTTLCTWVAPTLFAATATFTPMGATTVDPGVDVVFKVTVAVSSLSAFDSADVVIGSLTASDVSFSYDSAWTTAFSNVTTPVFDNGFYPQDVFVGANNGTAVGTSKTLGTVTAHTAGMGGGVHTIRIDNGVDGVSALGLAGQPDPLNGSGNLTVIGPPASPPTAAPAPHDRRKNRYISFAPNNTGGVAFQVTKTAGAGNLGVIGWVGTPDVNGISQIVPNPVTRVWTGAAVHVGDCEIIPVASYDIRATADAGGSFSPPLTVPTILQPGGGKFWGDTTGGFVGGAWDAPNTVVNVNDFQCVLQKFLGLVTAPHITVCDVQAVSSNDPCLNRVANIADVFLIIKAFQGSVYPFETNPANCPPCP